MPAEILDASNTAIRDSLVADVIRYENPQIGEFDLMDLRQFVDDALRAHDPTSSYEGIPVSERPLIVLLARINLSESRLANMAGREFPVSALGGSADRSSPAGRLLDYIRNLKDKYDEISSALGAGIGGEMPSIMVGELVRDEDIMDRTVPLSSNPGPEPTTISIYKAASSGSVWLRWVEKRIDDFYRYVLYRDTVAGLEDLTTLTDPDAVNRGVTASATEVVAITERWKTYYKDSGLLSGTYYYVVVTEDLGGKIAVSNELKVTVP